MCSIGKGSNNYLQMQTERKFSPFAKKKAIKIWDFVLYCAKKIVTLLARKINQKPHDTI